MSPYFLKPNSLILILCCGLGAITSLAADQNLNEHQSDARTKATLTPGLTSDFKQWLAANGYSVANFDRPDLIGGSYGGKAGPNDQLTREPIIFIHGNGDKALGQNPGQTGWRASIAYFQGRGYQSRELYATTWGAANPAFSASTYHARNHLEQIRSFIQAVLAYTGASKVDIITHSMGVTLTRKAIKGGSAYDGAAGGSYQLGNALTQSVDTFVGIAGANRGLVACFQNGGLTGTCNGTNGFYPGYMLGFWGPYGVSQYLANLNSSSGFEGEWIFSMWSTVDQVIGYGNLVYGQYTSAIPGQDDETRFVSVPYGHFNLKDLTGFEQWSMVTRHIAP